MNDLTLEYDSRANTEMQALMAHYNVKTKAELISKAISVLKIVSIIDKTKGELIARKDGRETKLNVR